MPLGRGEKHRADIGKVLDAFGDEARHFVFLGGCMLALYARPKGSPLRITNDVDCLSLLRPWIRQEQILGKLCASHVLKPDPDLMCRYRICGTNVDVDVISANGRNVGGTNPWLERGAVRARAYDLGDGRSVMAVTPPYFLATKLVAWEDRGPDPQSSKDAEDIVTLAVEVSTLVEEVEAEGLRANVSSLWAKALEKYKLDVDDLTDLVDCHLAREDTEHRTRVVKAIQSLARGSAS